MDKEVAKRIKEWIRMTKVARLFEAEKEEAMKRVAEQTAEETARETAIELLKDGVSIDKIAKYVKHLNVKEIEQLQSELKK